jgi:pyruvate ferredoxin oxidoreductase delta subunit
MSMKYDKPMTWQELPAGCLIDEASSSLRFKTGDWRSQRPIWDAEKCIQCLFCWITCPDSAIKVENEKVTGIDYDYCKGCGICAEVCPPRASAIEMVREEK